VSEQQFRVLTGVVSELKVHVGEEQFLAGPERTAVAGTAAGLAAVGFGGAAVGTSSAASASADSVEFFSCKVDGRPVIGRFSKASFKNGDQLEVVLSNERDPALAIAARRDADRTLWVAPHCSRGTKAHRRASLRLSLWLLLLGPAFVFSGYLILGVWLGSNRAEVSAMLFPVVVSVGLGWIAAAYMPTRFYFRWLAIARQAEAIFSAFGYANPSQVDLQRDHKRYCKAHGRCPALC
jgi:hypothetical protein